MGKVIRSVVMVSWDPLYKEDRSLARSAVQLKIGFELGRFKNLLENVSIRQAEENWEDFIPKGIN
jgi:hypothetical protein